MRRGGVRGEDAADSEGEESLTPPHTYSLTSPLPGAVTKYAWLNDSR